MTRTGIDFKELKDLGFKRIECPGDEVFFNINGYNYFIMTLKLHKGISAEWTPIDRTVEVYCTSGGGSHVIGKVVCNTMEEFKVFLKLFGR